LIKFENPELERLLADASAASGVEPGALLASLLRERVSMANDKENQGSVNPNLKTLVLVISHPRKTLLIKVKGNYMKKIHFQLPPPPR